MKTKALLRVIAVLICAAGFAPGLHGADPSGATNRRSQLVFFDGREVRFTPQHSYFGRDFKVGPWNLGTRQHEKASDKDPNLYIVVPGTEHTAAGYERFNHSRIISVLPKPEDECKWDIYWAIILDPTLEMDFHSEKELLVAAQESFVPGADFHLDQLAGYPILRDYLHLQSVDDLQKYRQPDGKLPGVLIVSAGASVRAGVTDPNAAPTNTPSATALAHH